jgi:sulfur carrier protein ThiS
MPVQLISVHFVGPVRRPGPERTLEVDADGIATVGELLARLGYAPHEVAALTVIADGARLAPEAPLAAVCSISILLAIGGG